MKIVYLIKKNFCVVLLTLLLMASINIFYIYNRDYSFGNQIFIYPEYENLEIEEININFLYSITKNHSDMIGLKIKSKEIISEPLKLYKNEDYYHYDYKNESRRINMKNVTYIGNDSIKNIFQNKIKLKVLSNSNFTFEFNSLENYDYIKEGNVEKWKELILDTFIIKSNKRLNEVKELLNGNLLRYQIDKYKGINSLQYEYFMQHKVLNSHWYDQNFSIKGNFFTIDKQGNIKTTIKIMGLKELTNVKFRFKSDGNFMQDFIIYPQPDYETLDSFEYTSTEKINLIAKSGLYLAGTNHNKKLKHLRINFLLSIVIGIFLSSLISELQMNRKKKKMK